MSEELKPCPFCGAAALHLTENEVTCGSINCEASMVAPTRDLAVAAWNRRADETRGCPHPHYDPPLERCPKHMDTVDKWGVHGCPACLGERLAKYEPQRAPSSTQWPAWGPVVPAPAPPSPAAGASFWVPAVPPGKYGVALYRARNPEAVGKLGEQRMLVTADIHAALQFPTREECEAWIRANPEPVFVAEEHAI